MPCPGKAPPHRERRLLQRGTTEPQNLFVSNLHNSPVCRDSSDSALYGCGKPLIGELFVAHAQARGVHEPACDARLASARKMAEIDSVVLHQPHSMLRCVHSPDETGAPAGKGSPSYPG